MMLTTRFTIGVSTRVENRRSASVAGTPPSICAAIFLISGVSFPYLPEDATTIASAGVLPNRPASAPSRGNPRGRPPVFLVVPRFRGEEQPEGPPNAPVPQ